MSDANALRVDRVPPRAVAYPERWILAAIVLAAFAERAIIGTASDVSWLLTLGERVLAGERPYVDFVEVNPPASIYLYVPALLLSRVSGLSPEFVVGLLMFAGIGASLWLSARILIEGRVIERRSVLPLASLFAAVLLVLPAGTFAQREHIALISFLPFLALTASRAEGKSAAIFLAATAGIGAGITVIIKPHFILPVLFVAAAAAYSRKSLRILFAPENWIAAAMVCGYGALVYFRYPEFVAHTLPMVAEIYLPVRANLWDFVSQIAAPVLALLLLLIGWMKGRDALRAPYSLLLAACCGFTIAFFVQQKAWPYHAYPALALAVAAAAIAFVERWPQTQNETARTRILRLSTAALMGFLAATAFARMSFAVDMRPLYDVIRQAALQPSVIAITSDIALGHPLTRALGGKWAGRVCSQWITTGARILKPRTADSVQRARYDELEAYDRNLLIEDIRRARPDIILVERFHFDWMKWATSDAALARELDNYRPLAEIERVLILRRK